MTDRVIDEVVPQPPQDPFSHLDTLTWSKNALSCLTKICRAASALLVNERLNRFGLLCILLLLVIFLRPQLQKRKAVIVDNSCQVNFRQSGSLCHNSKRAKAKHLAK
jgi:hypothetical protein